MKLLQPGENVDGFVIGECIHSGGMAHIYSVHFDEGRPDPGFPMIMKVPRMTAGDGAENIIGFEIEAQILSVLRDSHVPRFVAAGDLTRLPYLVMEYVPGKTLQHWLDHAPPVPQRDLQQVWAIGAALAHAVHSLHKQNTCHLDLKPANALLRDDGSVVLLDFGLSCHAHYPDLLAEEMRKAVGSPTWIAPEQVVGVRGDPRSDVFALGVILYEMCTGELPFGSPATAAGMRQRLWMQPRPPRQLRADMEPWLQEIILKCLESHADHRYPSAAHVAFDLTHPTQVVISHRGHALRGLGFWPHFKRWIRAAGMHYQPSPLPTQQITQVPIVMVAVPFHDVKDETLYALRLATSRALGSRPGARLACITVLSPSQTSSTDAANSETELHRQYLAMLKQWSQGLDLLGHQASFHVLESGDVAHAILNYARGNHVNIIVMGAATHGVRLQHFVATVPMKVAMDAPCTVMLVKQELPFAMLGDIDQADAAVHPA